MAKLLFLLTAIVSFHITLALSTELSVQLTLTENLCCQFLGEALNDILPSGITPAVVKSILNLVTSLPGLTPANNNILSNCLNSLKQPINNGGNLNLLILDPELLQDVEAFLTCLTTSCTPVGINNSTGEIPNGINFNGSFPSANITYANNNQGFETAEITCDGYPGYFTCINYYLNGTQVGQNCNNITLGQAISINETCNNTGSGFAWSPVSLDAVSCNYLLPPCAKCQLIGTNQDTEAPDSSTYQINNQWCLAAEIVCAGNASSFACMDYNLNGTQLSQTCTGVLGGPITLDETCTNVTQWGPVDLDSVGCVYVPEIGIQSSYPNTTNQTLPTANVTYQNFAQGYPEAIITCPAQPGYYLACVDFYLNGTQVGQNCANNVTVTWNSQRQWGPVQLDSVGCTYYPCIHVDPTPSGYIGALMDADVSQSFPTNINNPPMFTNPSTGASTTNASYAYWRPTSSPNPFILSYETFDAAFDFYQSPACSPCFCVTNQNCYQPFASDYSGYMIPYCDTNGNCEMLAATAAATGPYTPFVNSAGQAMPENFYDNYNTGVYLQVVGFGCNGCGALQSKLAKICPADSTTPMPTTTTPLAIN